jgi:hypothetical protein
MSLHTTGTVVLALVGDFPLLLQDILSRCGIQPGPSIGYPPTCLARIGPVFISSALHKAKTLGIAQITEDETP